MHKIDTTTSETLKAALGAGHGLLIVHYAGQWFLMDTKTINKNKIVREYVGETCWLFGYVSGWKDGTVEFETVKDDLVNQIKATYKGF